MSKQVINFGMVLFAVAGLSGLSYAQTNAPAAEVAVIVDVEEGVPGGVYVNALALQAKVVSIDYETRKLGLLMPSGEVQVIEVGPEAVNFNQIKVEDLVKVVVAEELVVAMGSEDAELADGEAAVVVRAAEGEQPGAIVADTVRATATITAIDTEARTATLEFEDGSVKTVPVRPDIDLTQHKVGEKVVFQITEMIAISVEKQ